MESEMVVTGAIVDSWIEPTQAASLMVPAWSCK